MTVEERARECAAEMGAGDIWERAIEAIEKHLHDQIEDCAQVCESESFNNQSDYSSACEDLARLLRALAAPGESKTEDDDVADRFKPGGFWFQ